MQQLKSQQLFIDAVTYLNNLLKHEASSMGSYHSYVIQYWKKQDHLFLQNVVSAFLGRNNFNLWVFCDTTDFCLHEFLSSHLFGYEFNPSNLVFENC